MLLDLHTCKLYDELKEKHYTHVPFNIPELALQDAIQAFLKFLDEPEDIKSLIDFSIATKHRRGDVGYKHRNSEDGIYDDNKDFFHYHPAIFEKYADFLNTNPIVHEFMLKAKPIWEHTYQVMQDILAQFEADFPNISEKIFNTKYPHVLLRFIRYEWENAGKYLAKPHFDAGSYTLAIAESAPGLRIGSGPDDLALIEHKKGKAIFMLSSNFQKIMNTDVFSAGWHDVIQVDETKLGKSYARWAIVAFIEAHNVEALPRSETHKWYINEATS